MMLSGRFAGEDKRYYTAKIFIEGKLFHTGWLSLYDTVGIVGAIAFIWLAVSEIFMAAHLVFASKVMRESSLFPLFIWLFIGCWSTPFIFFAVFGDFAQSFMTMCINAVVLTHLYNLAHATDNSIVPIDPSRAVEFKQIAGLDYGYKPRA